MATPVHSQPRYTKRLMLRPFRRRDLGPFHEAVTESMSELQPWLPWLEGYDKGFAQRFIRESANAWTEGKAFDLAIRPRVDLDHHLGNVSIWPTSVQNQIGEVGYWVRSGETGKGFATEAAIVAIGIGFNELNLHKVVLRIAVGNVASEKIAEKLGFIYEGVLRDEVKVTGRWLDHTSWSMLASEWARRAPALGVEDTYL